jgi:hypothetical protein
LFFFLCGAPASSTTKNGRYDIAEILLKVALKHQKINQSINEEELIFVDFITQQIDGHYFFYIIIFFYKTVKPNETKLGRYDS